MKKILIVATVQSHIAQFHLPIIEVFKTNGYEIHIAGKNNLSSKSGLKLKGVDKCYDIPFERSPFNLKNIAAYKKLQKIINYDYYDVIQCNTPVGGIITRIAARKSRKIGTKVIYMAHGFHFYKGAPLKNWILYYPIEKIFSRYTDILITINLEDFNFARKNFNCKVEHWYGVGVSNKKFYVHDENDDILVQYKAKLRITKNDFCLICIGELNKNKNQITLIKAMKEILKDCPNLKLLIAGNGPNEKYLKEEVHALGLDEHVLFLGYTRELDKIIPLCKCLVSCSWREGLPLNIIEGLLCGKPVIASKNRGHNELIIDNVNGFLFDKGDYLQCSKLIRKIYFDRNLLNKLSSSASSSVENYTLNNVLKKIKI